MTKKTYIMPEIEVLEADSEIMVVSVRNVYTDGLGDDKLEKGETGDTWSDAW